MINAEMKELAGIIYEIEYGDDQIEPMHDLYVTVKRMIKKKRPELLKSKEDAVFDLKFARKSVKRLIAEYPELKVKAETILEKNIWHRQSDEDIYDAFNDWSLHEFACIMKDGTVQKFTGILDECYDGSINKHVDCGVDGFECDDIEYWLEFPEKN